MPAVSKAQQRLFGLVKAVKSGDVKSSAVSKDVKDIAKSMSTKEIDKFAGTKHKGLPEKKKKEESVQIEELRNTIREVINQSIISEALPTSNAHPWVLKSMEELRDDLDFYLGPKNQYAGSKIDFNLLKKKMNELTKLINKYNP
jgi:hypothetical protein